MMKFKIGWKYLQTDTLPPPPKKKKKKVDFFSKGGGV